MIGLGRWRCAAPCTFASGAVIDGAGAALLCDVRHNPDCLKFFYESFSIVAFVGARSDAAAMIASA